MTLTSNRACLMQTKPDPRGPTIEGPDGKFHPRWRARVIGFEPGVPVEFPFKEELEGAWCLGGGTELRFTRSE